MIREVLRASFKEFFSEKHTVMSYFASLFLYELVYIIFLRVLFMKVPSFHGLGFYDVLCIFGMFQVVFSLFHLYFAYFIWFQEKYVWDRGLDVVLSMPVNVIYYITLLEIPGQIMEITGLVVGIIVFSIGAIGAGMGLCKIFLGLLIFVPISLVIFTGFSLVLLSIGFILYGRHTPFELFYEIAELGQYPVNLFPKVLRVIFTYVFPLLQIATLPYLILKDLSFHNMLFLLGAAFFWGMLGLWCFNKSLEKYQSGG